MGWAQRMWREGNGVRTVVGLVLNDLAGRTIRVDERVVRGVGGKVWESDRQTHRQAKGRA